MGDVSHAAALEAGHKWTTKGPKMPGLMHTVCGQICDFKAALGKFSIHHYTFILLGKWRDNFAFLSPYPQNKNHHLLHSN